MKYHLEKYCACVHSEEHACGPQEVQRGQCSGRPWQMFWLSKVCCNQWGKVLSWMPAASRPSTVTSAEESPDTAKTLSDLNHSLKLQEITVAPLINSIPAWCFGFFDLDPAKKWYSEQQHTYSWVYCIWLFFQWIKIGSKGCNQTQKYNNQVSTFPISAGALTGMQTHQCWLLSNVLMSYLSSLAFWGNTSQCTEKSNWNHRESVCVSSILIRRIAIGSR